MTRHQLAETAQKLADTYPRSKLRVVVIVADETGDFVGVGMNTSFTDARQILRCAHEGEDLQLRNAMVPQ